MTAETRRGSEYREGVYDGEQQFPCPDGLAGSSESSRHSGGGGDSGCKEMTRRKSWLKVFVDGMVGI